MDGAIFSFGISFASRSTVLPVYVKSIGGDSVAISLIPVLWILGFNLPQIAVANIARQVSPKKPLFLKTALVQRIPWLLLAIATFGMVGRVDATVALLLFFVLFTLAAAAGSVNLPIWFDLVAKVTPVRMRGRMFAMRTVVGAVLGIAAGWAAEAVLASMSYPYGFGLLFGLAFGAMMVSYVFLTFIQEGEEEVPKRSIKYKEYLKSLPDILRREKNFRNFLIGESILIAVTMVEGFFAVDAIESFGLPESHAGRFTVVVMLSMGLSTFVCGYLADHLGHRINFILASLGMALACIAALLADRVEVYYLAFAGSALTVGLRTISRLPIIAEICGEEDRPTFVALSNVITAPFVLAGVAGGWVALRLGYDVVFAAAGVLSILSAIWFAIAVHEPRVLKRGML